MKYIIKLTVIAIFGIMFSFNSVIAQEHDHSHKQNDKDHQKMDDAKKYDKNDDGSVYQCSMNPDQILDEPGECSKCGMKLMKVSVDDANKNLENMSMKNHDKMMKDGKHKMDHDKMMKDGKHKMDHDKMMKDGKHKMDHDKMMKDGKHKMDHSKMIKDGEHKMKNSMVHEGIIDLNAIDKNGDKKVFQDQMDWNVISDEPGTCPLCEMKLKEVTIYEAKTKLIENGFKIK